MASSDLDPFSVVEEIRGPVYGYWVACYACERRRGFVAYGKVCNTRPDSVWETPTAFLKLTIGPRATAESALDALYAAAQAWLARRTENQPTRPDLLNGPLG